jgi:hypothetical protein
MSRTYFKDFTRENGQPITVEYHMEGDTCACITSAWPNTEEYNQLIARQMELQYSGPYGKRALVAIMDPDVREELIELDRLIEAEDETARLSDTERERFEAWLSENYIQESDDIAF